MSEVSLTARLTDQVSGPAKAGAAALKEEAAAAKALSQGLAAAGGGGRARDSLGRFVGGASPGLADAGAKLKGFQTLAKGMSEIPLFGRLIGDSEKFGGTLAKMFGGSKAGGMLSGLGTMFEGVSTKLEGMGIDPKAAMGALAGGAAAAAAAVVAVGVAIGMVVFKLGELAAKGAMAFAKMTVESGMFRENTLISLTTMLKSQEAADRVYASAIKVARETPLETQQVIDAYTKMLAGGFKEADLEPMMRGISDFTSALGPEKLDQVVRAFSRIKTEGRLGGEAVQQLADAGLPIQDLMKKLGVKNMQDMYGMDGAKALAAIMETINERFGGLSSARSKSLGGLWSSLSSAPFELWSEALDKTQKDGTGVSSLYNAIKGSISDLLDIVSGGGGKKAVEIINAIGGGLGALANILKGFGTGVIEGLLKGLESSGAAKQFEAMAKLDLKSSADTAKALGVAIGELAGWLVMLAFALGSVAKFMNDHQTAMLILGVTTVVVTALLGFLAVVIAAVVIVVILAFTVFLVALAVVLLICAASVTVLIAAFLVLVAILFWPIIAIALLIVYFDDLWAAATNAVNGITASFGGLGDSISSAVVGAFSAALGACVSAAANMGGAAAQAFTNSFTPSIDTSFMGASLAGPGGGFGSANASMGTGPSPYSNMTLTAPSGAFPAPSSMPQQAIPTDKQKGDTNLHVSVSGVGKTDEELAWLITSKVKEEMKKGAGT